MSSRPEAPTVRRPGDRAADALRPLTLELDALKFAEGSAQIHLGDTRALVAATIEPGKIACFLLGLLFLGAPVAAMSPSSCSPQPLPGGQAVALEFFVGGNLGMIDDPDIELFFSGAMTARRPGTPSTTD